MSESTEHPTLGTCTRDPSLPPPPPRPRVAASREVASLGEAAAVVTAMLALLATPGVMAVTEDGAPWVLVRRLGDGPRYTVHVTLTPAQAEAAGVLWAEEVGG